MQELYGNKTFFPCIFIAQIFVLRQRILCTRPYDESLSVFIGKVNALDRTIKALICRFLACAWCIILIVDYFVMIGCNCSEGGSLMYDIDTM